MSLGKHLGLTLLAVLTTFFAACTSGSSSSTNTIQTALQDLGLDDAGTTTVLTFHSASGLAAATTANFECDGGQTPTLVAVVDDEVTVEWSARVTPNDQVRATGLSGVATAYHAVTTSDSSAPTFTIANATQTPGLGGDTIDVAFAGPHVVEATAEDTANWVLETDGTALDISDATFDFDDVAQTLTITLGTNANLHADISLTASGVLSVADVVADSTPVSGTATGDAVAPTLLSAEQNLTEDEFGRVIDFTFDKAMDPVFSTQLSHFGVDLPRVAIDVAQPSEDVLRVTFNGPIVPGFTSVTLSSLVDLHGNAFPDGIQAISQSTSVVNSFDGQPAAVTVPNATNDYVVVTTTQAFDPESAEDPTKWTLDVNGSSIDLTAQTLTYDLLTKTLTIALDFDMQNGTPFTITGISVLDVDGDTFSDSAMATVSGDTAPPAVSNVLQNRTFDPTGATLDVQLNEDVELTSSETLGNWTISGSQTLLSATRLAGLDTVRLVFDAAVIPGDYTLAVDNVSDLAGNTMSAPQTGLAVYTDDAVAPDPVLAQASAVEGLLNDTFTVVFDDDMIESEIETTTNWHIESPIGTPVSTAGTSIVYDSGTRTATLTLANGVNLHRGDDFSVDFTVARDLGGNIVMSTNLTGAVDSETTLPTVQTVYRSTQPSSPLVVRFSEPCDALDDLYDASTNPTGTRYALRTSGGTLRGYATAATALDSGLGVEVAFGIVPAVSDTIDVIGVRDLAGNPCFPVYAMSTVAEDLTQPSLGVGQSVFTSVSGAGNDVITVKFDRPMSPWQLLAPANYTITIGATTLDLTHSAFTFDGTDTVTIALGTSTGNDLQTGGSYDISIDDVWSAQGTQRTVAETETGIVCGGDSTDPNVLSNKIRIDPIVADSLLIEVNEDVDLIAAETATNYDYNGGNLATSATLIGPRTIRATFAVTPTPGNSLAVTVVDRAGNSASTSRAVIAADTTGPVIGTVAGTIRPGFGGDQVTVAFNEPVDVTSALAPANYSVRTGATTLSLSGATFTYEGNTNTVTIALASGQELQNGAALSVTVSNVLDVAGNAMPAPVTIGGSTSGDSTAPGFSTAFVNLHADPNGLVVDVKFDEDVKPTFVGNTANWTATGTSVASVEVLEKNHCRVTLAAALGVSGTLGTTALPDYAGNTSGVITVDPTE